MVAMVLVLKVAAIDWMIEIDRSIDHILSDRDRSIDYSNLSRSRWRSKWCWSMITATLATPVGRYKKLSKIWIACFRLATRRYNLRVWLWVNDSDVQNHQPTATENCRLARWLACLHLEHQKITLLICKF